jgi:hypothetical protein
MKSKELKRMEAEERQAAHERLSVEEKVKKAHSRRGESKRELKRLEGDDGHRQK